jgi:hypothetical protein
MKHAVKIEVQIYLPAAQTVIQHHCSIFTKKEHPRVTEIDESLAEPRWTQYAIRKVLLGSSTQGRHVIT